MRGALKQNSIRIAACGNPGTEWGASSLAQGRTRCLWWPRAAPRGQRGTARSAGPRAGSAGGGNTDRAAIDAAHTKFKNHPGTKVVVVDHNQDIVVRLVKNSYTRHDGEEVQQWQFDEEMQIWSCQVCTCGSGRTWDPCSKDTKFGNKMKHNGTATHNNALLSKKHVPGFEDGDVPIRWPTGLTLTTEKDYITWAMTQPVEGVLCQQSTPARSALLILVNSSSPRHC